MPRKVKFEQLQERKFKVNVTFCSETRAPRSAKIQYLRGLG